MKTLPRGFTMIELIVVLAIGAMLATAALPMWRDYSINNRLRAGGNLLLSEALFAQTEALKRNANVTLSVTTQSVNVIDVTTGETLRSRELPDNVLATSHDIVIGGKGRPTPFGVGADVDLSMVGVTCSDQFRCPRLIVEGGGGIRLCANQLDCSSL